MFFSIRMSNSSSPICWKDVLFSLELPLRLCQKSNGHFYTGPFLDSIMICVLLLHQYHIVLAIIALK